MIDRQRSAARVGRLLALGLGLVLLLGLLCACGDGLSGEEREALAAQAAEAEARSEDCRAAIEGYRAADAATRPAPGPGLVAYLTDEDRYSDDWVPEELRAETTDELGGILRLQKLEPSRGQAGGFAVSLLSLDGRVLIGPEELRAGEDLLPQRVADWARDCWSGLRLGESAEELSGYRWLGKGDKLCIVKGGRGTIYLNEWRDAFPPELLAAAPCEIGAELAVSEYGPDGLRAELRVLDGDIWLAETRELKGSHEEICQALRSWLAPQLDEMRQLRALAQAIDRGATLGGGDKALARRDGRLCYGPIGEELRAASPEEVGLVLEYRDWDWYAVDPLSGETLGYLRSDDREKQQLEVEKLLKGLLLRRDLPGAIQRGELDPAATKLVRWNAERELYDLQYIPEELQAGSVGEVRGVVHMESSFRKTGAWYSDDEGSFYVELELETCKVWIEDPSSGRTMLSHTFTTQIPGTLVTSSGRPERWNVDVSVFTIEAWLQENWKG